MSGEQEYDVEDAARVYGVTRQTIYDWRDKYSIGTLKYKKWIFTRSELDRASEQANNTPAGAPRKGKGGLFGFGK